MQADRAGALAWVERAEASLSELARAAPPSATASTRTPKSRGRVIRLLSERGMCFPRRKSISKSRPPGFGRRGLRGAENPRGKHGQDRKRHPAARSGPRCGLGEFLPLPRSAGLVHHAGKVNPVIPRW